MTPTRRGFTFAEILVALVVLTMGIIPLIIALTEGTRQTRISLQQVQGANHASNLLEAMQAFGFRGVMRLPTTMVQLRGNDNQWQAYGAGMELGFEGVGETGDNPGDPKAFDDFKGRFFGTPPVVPPLEPGFTRYYHLIRDPEHRYVTVVVRVEWYTKVEAPGGTMQPALRSVELRTVFADPYQGGSG